MLLQLVLHFFNMGHRLTFKYFPNKINKNTILSAAFKPTLILFKKKDCLLGKNASNARNLPNVQMLIFCWEDHLTAD